MATRSTKTEPRALRWARSSKAGLLEDIANIQDRLMTINRGSTPHLDANVKVKQALNMIAHALVLVEDGVLVTEER